MLQVVQREKIIGSTAKMIKNGRYREKREAFEFSTKKKQNLGQKCHKKKSLIQIIDKLWIFRFAFENLLKTVDIP